jgi:hypothetical protein
MHAIVLTFGSPMRARDSPWTCQSCPFQARISRSETLVPPNSPYVNVVVGFQLGDADPYNERLCMGCVGDYIYPREAATCDSGALVFVHTCTIKVALDISEEFGHRGQM